MKCKIVEKEAFQIAGKAIQTTMDKAQNKVEIPAFWEEVNHNGFIGSLKPFAGPLGFLGVCMDFDERDGTFTYVIGIEKTAENLPESCIVKEVPASTWAVFDAVGPVNPTVQATWERIFSEWFPATGYEHADAPEFEAYRAGGNISADDYVTQIWIPIVKKR
ncbi:MULTISPECIES: GyrI-like domain-containing protein [Bacillus]|uniref:GyrI-like domain-containing protein n=1 Tax=Bacillus TaxID=1386 RepID=UPI001B2A3D33|nr:GyrI-like domain-containing protein [Bacillus sonorensis]GIN69096.1 hypothetical protein J41TS2_45170 [Bacillus sonorensis]